MDEHSFLERIQSTPGDIDLLREYAHWLVTNKDPRGKHLIAELDVRVAKAQLIQSEYDLFQMRSVRSCDFEWLDSILPLNVMSPVEGKFYCAPAPDELPFIKLGDFCFPDTIIGIVESLKVFHKIPATYSGIVDEIVVTPGASVTSGEILIKLVRPQKPISHGKQSNYVQE
ncbi:biotin/lipoyl-containing protein [Rubinisphaera sp.]|uniref:acetyl-CoA carboxylase biotin carboxyl carrier protein n=1 Tax=Rubinisphaera sp. TaxID=2024857 RepID=UPI000C0D0CEF|nr:biotin/lipoyl-containing protein [Rubinisphaera sp.]MBV12327.1 hypothetical protein [Rubinisphaera sp.]HCS54564.1 hypothetical protein [Planctomycetaceae bacterium]|tara:strand:+ start:2185 stop:2697 length:513 start_codon:yes stop_codon:yes gene_type:complete